MSNLSMRPDWRRQLHTNFTPSRAWVMSSLLSLIGLVCFAGQVSQQTGPLLSSPSEEVLYRHLFRHVLKYQQIADRDEAAGEPSPFRHSFRTKLELNPTEEDDLNFIAADTAIQLETVQAQIVQVMRTFRANYPVGLLAPGSVLAPPPPELAPLVAQKRAIVLAARDRLRTELGNDEFKRLDSLVKTRIAPQVTSRKVSQ